MGNFEQEYADLNKAQLKAVDIKHVDGPMLVVAGPGTGKTQLLGMRVANILKKTDTLPQNILCLTFTENGALNMRDRLTRFIGKDAYDVNIGTYHAFGGDLIRRFPEYFVETRLQSPVDELGKYQILAAITDSLSYANPLKPLRHNIKDLISTVSELKRALLKPEDILAIAAENKTFIEKASKDIGELCAGIKSFPSSFAKADPLYSSMRDAVRSYLPEKPVNERFGSLASAALLTLQTAYEEAQALNKSGPLTAWKNDWLDKDGNNDFVIAGRINNERLHALAAVLEQYQKALENRGLYDFDDMIIRSIEALISNDDLRFTLQEQYQYILLDEFQDTNAAQLKLVELLTNNPLSDGRPNVMAVGDDDQAIYAFQGAQYSNMVDFYNLYKDVAIVSLEENYRSHSDVLATAQNVSEQIEARLTDKFPEAHATLLARGKKLPVKATIDRSEFLSDVAEYGYIADQIHKLIKAGTDHREIAVLAPKHKILEALVPYLNALDIPVHYEKSENILEAPVIRQILAMTRLVLALQSDNSGLADSLWPEVLSSDFWGLPTAQIWQLSWQISDEKARQLRDGQPVTAAWSRTLLASKDAKLRTPALLFLTLADLARQETCENMLDYLIGSRPLSVKDSQLSEVVSPLRDYYTGEEMQAKQPQILYQTLSQLTVLRARLREHQATRDQTLELQDLVDFVDLYEAAEVPMLNTSPYNQQAAAVQLMTVFKAKGLEFEHVFLPHCQNDIWGSKATSQHNSLSLPINMLPIRHAGSTEDERLRMLYVAITRAKFGLHLTSFSHAYTGKPVPRLKYFDEQEQEDGSFDSLILPTASRHVVATDFTTPAEQLLELGWHDRHTAFAGQVTLQDLLADRLQSYQLSPTHLNSFVDLIYGGPEKFFFTTILRFPEAPTTDGQFGNAIHETLEWLQHYVSEHGKAPSDKQTIDQFVIRIKHKGLSAAQLQLEIERGELALPIYLAARGAIFQPTDKAETNFKNEGVLIGDAHLSGKIDRLEIDKDAKTITVVDYKTGKGFNAWKSDAKLHKYKQQLYCYKLLIEHAHSFAGYRVVGGRLEFIEPNEHGMVDTLALSFDDAETERTKLLIQALWQHVKTCSFPDVSNYPDSLTGIRQFEQDLLDGTV